MITRLGISLRCFTRPYTISAGKGIIEINGLQIHEADIEEKFVSGSGPGGQSVNKTVNCCQLKHKPSGVVVKVHQTRSLQTNRKIARELLATKLDNLYNGDESLEARKRREVQHKLSIKEEQSEKRREMKKRYKKQFDDIFDDAY